MSERQICRPSLCILTLIAFLFARKSNAAPIGRQLDVASATNSEQQTLWKSDHARYLIGLTEIHPKAQGELVITAKEVRFESHGQHAVIPLDTVSAVGVGNERVERGGLPVQLARMAMYDGSGVLVAAVFHHVVDLLTIEYRGNHGEYHGVVFVLPRNEAATALVHVASLIQPSEADDFQYGSSCTDRTTALKSVTISPITIQAKSANVQLPPEYRVLLYEHVVQRLQGDSDHVSVYRSEAKRLAPICSDYSVEVTVTAFKKGDNAVRASSGPLGIFLGTTMLAYDLRIRDADGALLLEKNMKSVIRGENESLDITAKIAKSIEKAFAMVQKTRRDQAFLKLDAK